MRGDRGLICPFEVNDGKNPSLKFTFRTFRTKQLGWVLNPPSGWVIIPLLAAKGVASSLS
jgi:hypothetical protein